MSIPTSLNASPRAIASTELYGDADVIVRTPELVVGASKINAITPEILALRARTGQANDLTTDPQYFMAANAAVRNRRPAVVLIRKDQTLELEGCVLFYEHCAFGIGLGMYRGGDYMGESLVVGPEAMRTRFVHLAVQSLLRRWRIHGVSLSVKAPLEECIAIMGPESNSRRFQGKTVQHKFLLAETYQATLARVGHRTRRSLQTKREHLEKSTSVEFIPVLKPDEVLQVMFALQPVSLPVRKPRFSHARHRLLCDRPNFFGMGLRLPDGTWLSVLSGWRIGRTTYIDLQMNHVNFKKESISAVMRAFMLEHEVGLKQELLNFVGGSSILLRRYCEPLEPCTDAFIWRPGLQAKIFEALATRFRPGTVYERLGPQPEGAPRREDIME